MSEEHVIIHSENAEPAEFHAEKHGMEQQGNFYVVVDREGLSHCFPIEHLIKVVVCLCPGSAPSPSMVSMLDAMFGGAFTRQSGPIPNQQFGFRVENPNSPYYPGRGGW